MARYFFHLYNDEISHDEEGCELPADEDALEHARQEARIQAAESVRACGHLVRHHNVTVLRSDGSQLAVVTFGSVVEIKD